MGRGRGDRSLVVLVSEQLRTNVACQIGPVLLAFDIHNPNMETVSRRKPYSPPQYHSLEYWSARFSTETAFEWLGKGSASLLPALLPLLSETAVSPRLFHIGCGNSGAYFAFTHVWSLKNQQTSDSNSNIFGGSAVGQQSRS